jgi:hypothetical protein
VTVRRGVGVAILSAIVATGCSGEERPAPGRAVPVRAGSPAPVAAASPAPAPAPPSFHGGVFRIGPFLRARLIGRNWHPGCPVGIDDLRQVRVDYWDVHGHVRSGPLIVHETVADDVLWVFGRLFHADFLIHRIALPPAYRPPRPEDRLSTRNLTAAYNCRPATGNPGSVSEHSYGWAIDINPLLNPYVRSDGSVLRRAVKPYLDRSRRVPGMIHPGDIVVRSFARIGWAWGGDWMTLKDYMHFSLSGR